MNTNQPIRREQFEKRLANLCLRSGLAGIPKDDQDQHILLKSTVLCMGSLGPFTEQEINAKLEVWLIQVCPIQRFDRVTLRRWLVDSGYLVRSSDGSSYTVAQPEPRAGFFEASVDQIDILQTIRAARDEMERRKQAYLEKSRGA